MQLDYNNDMNKGYPGLIGSLVNSTIRTKAAQHDIGFGMGVVSGSDADKQIRVPINDTGTLLFDADFVTDNVINLTVNGVAIVPVTFATSHAATLTLLTAAIALLTGINAVELGARSVTISGSDIDIVVTNIIITAGSSQAGGVFSQLYSSIFRGFTVHTHKQANLTHDTAVYSDKEAVNYMTKGDILVPTSKAVSQDESVYIVVGGTDAGKATNEAVSGKNVATNAKFLTTITGAGLTEIELNKVMPI